MEFWKTLDKLCISSTDFFIVEHRHLFTDSEGRARQGLEPSPKGSLRRVRGLPGQGVRRVPSLQGHDQVRRHRQGKTGPSCFPFTLVIVQDTRDNKPSVNEIQGYRNFFSSLGFPHGKGSFLWLILHKVSCLCQAELDFFDFWVLSPILSQDFLTFGSRLVYFVETSFWGGGGLISASEGLISHRNSCPCLVATQNLVI